MNKKKQIGTCAICGEEKELTFEHYPPQAAMNKEPIFIKDFRHLTPLDNPYLVGKSIRSNRGMGGHKLCGSCNSNSGDWYAREYSRVANLFIDEVIRQRESSVIKYKLKIKPLNFFKQVLILHLCADNDLGELREVLDSKRLILERHFNSISKDVNVHMYTTLSPTHRVIGVSSKFCFRTNNVVALSEFNFHPFGFLLTLDSNPPNLGMMNITSFKNYAYDQEETINFMLPNLEVKSSMIGEYP